MRNFPRLLGFLAVAFCVSVEFAHGQTESGFPLCKEDGSIPDGYSQCDCKKTLNYRGEFRDAKREFRVQLPDGVVGIGGCVPGRPFRIYLPDPRSGETGGDFGWNFIWVSGTERSRESFQQIIEGWKQSLNEDVKEDRRKDLLLSQPETTSLGSLAALRLRATWTDRDDGRLMSEVILANHPEKSIVYEIGMISPTESWEKNHKLFDAVLASFKYNPREDADKH